MEKTIYMCLDCGHEFASDENAILNFTIYCPKCKSGETEPHRHPQEAKICTACDGSGKVFVCAGEEDEGYDDCPICEEVDNARV